MNHSYNVDHHNKYNSMTTSLHTDPDLYALKTRKKTAKPDNHLASTNRIAYVEALVGNEYTLIYFYGC